MKPKGMIGINGKKPIGIGDILPYLPNESGFVDTRHWVWGGQSATCLRANPALSATDNTIRYEDE